VPRNLTFFIFSDSRAQWIFGLFQDLYVGIFQGSRSTRNPTIANLSLDIKSFWITPTSFRIFWMAAKNPSFITYDYDYTVFLWKKRVGYLWNSLRRYFSSQTMIRRFCAERTKSKDRPCRNKKVQKRLFKAAFFSPAFSPRDYS